MIRTILLIIMISIHRESWHKVKIDIAHKHSHGIKLFHMTEKVFYLVHWAFKPRQATYTTQFNSLKKKKATVDPSTKVKSTRSVMTKVWKRWQGN